MTYVDKQPNSKVLVHLLVLLESHGEILPTRSQITKTQNTKYFCREHQH